MIFASIRHNLANLFHLSGRESRGLFWPYAIAIFLLAMAADILLIIPIMFDQMARTMAYVRAHPEGLPRPAPGQPPALPPELMPDMSRMIAPMRIVTIAAILLLAAAVARRLHDRGKPGWWGALPLPFQAFGFVIAPAAVKAMTTFPIKPSPLALISALNSLCAWGAIIFLIVLLAGEGTKGPNPFGDAPRPAA